MLKTLCDNRVLGAAVAFAASVSVVFFFWLLVPERYRVPTLLEYGEFYEPVARSIQSGDGLVTAEGTMAIRYPPGHPVILASAFALAGWTGISEAFAQKLLVLSCMGATAALLFLVAADIWGSRNGMLVPLAFAFFPLALWLTLQPLSEITFLPVLALAVLLLWRGMCSRDDSMWQFAAAGVAIGAAMLIRPAAIGLGVVVAGALILTDRHDRLRRSFWRATFVLVGCALVVFPWEALVFARTGRVIPLSTGGPSSIHDGLTFAIHDKGYRTAPPPSETVARFMIEVDRGYVESGSSSIAVVAVGALKSNPAGAIRLGLWKSFRAWYGTDSRRREGWVLAIQIPVVFLLLVATVRTVRLGGEAGRLAILLAACVGYFWLVTTAALSIVRYMIPMICIWFLVLPALIRSRTTAPRANVRGESR